MTTPIKLKRSDPFDIPPHMVPAGLKYEWIAKTIMREPYEGYAKALKAGWTPVPAQWHRPFYDPDDFPDGPVEYGGQVLLCHHKPRDEELDRIGGAQKNIDNWMKKFAGDGISGGVRMLTETAAGVSEVKTLRLGDRAIADKILQVPLPPPEPSTPIPPLPTPPPPDVELPIVAPSAYRPVRVSRFSWLTWLFNLISVER